MWDPLRLVFRDQKRFSELLCHAMAMGIFRPWDRLVSFRNPRWGPIKDGVLGPELACLLPVGTRWDLLGPVGTRWDPLGPGLSGVWYKKTYGF